MTPDDRNMTVEEALAYGREKAAALAKANARIAELETSLDAAYDKISALKLAAYYTERAGAGQ